MKKNSMGLNKYEYAQYLRELASIALQGAHDAGDPRHAEGQYNQAAACDTAARRTEASA